MLKIEYFSFLHLTRRNAYSRQNGGKDEIYWLLVANFTNKNNNEELTRSI